MLPTRDSACKGMNIYRHTRAYGLAEANV